VKILDKADNPENRKGRERYPSGLWPALINAICGYAKQRRAEYEQQDLKIHASIAGWTKWTAIGTFLAAVIAGGAALVFNGQLRAMKEANEDNRKAFLQTNRAWMKPDEVAPSISQNAFVPDGLFFPRHGFPGFLGLHIVVRNVGRSPAFNVRVGAWTLYGYAQKIENLREYEEKLCATLDSYPTKPQLIDNTGYAATVFPNDTVSFDETGLALQPKDMEKYSSGVGAGRGFALWLYGCIRYTFAESKIPHKTGFAFRAGNIIDVPGAPGGKAMEVGFRPYVNVPAKQIRLDPRPMALGSAD